ncbi:MAG: hypothetical protein NC453_24935 [Muribaculum sp.]|nr:hypothetical protein [Muribaculum sp.]
MLPKTERVGRSASSIKLDYADNVDEQIVKAVEYAASVWESYIQNSVELYVEINTVDINDDILTDVRYRQDNGILFPTALQAYKNQEKEREHTTPDGIITISSRTNWDFGLGENISSGGVNLAYGIMRSLGRIMGFGSNATVDENGDYRFTDKRYHSVFNGLVRNSSGKYLNELKVNKGMPSIELKNYIEDPVQNFWVTTVNGNFKLSSPPYTTSCPPFVFLDDESSLMRANLRAGDFILDIDQTTLSIINEMGWNIHIPKKIEISSEDIPESGLASAYRTHGFHIKNAGHAISNPKWTLSMPLPDGTTECIELPDDNLSCRIGPIEDETKYKVSQDGYIKASLDFACVINGSEETAFPFAIYFELKPYIEYASVEDIIDNHPFDSYNVHYKVKYRGADKIKVSVEEEYSPEIKVKYIREPYIAYGTADNVSDSFYVWIDFTAENEYGKTVHTIELQPGGVVSDGIKSTNRHSGIGKVTGASREYYELYRADGRRIGVFSHPEQFKLHRDEGIVIVRHIIDGIITETFKIANSL